MTMFVEGDLQVSFGKANDAIKFDGVDHGLSHCMKAVDFIVEFENRYLFVEFKDPMNPGSTRGSGQKFVGTFNSGQLDSELVYKYRDSLLYQWASGKTDKPIHYFVVIAWDQLNSAELSTSTDRLKRKLPTQGPSNGSWTRPLVSNCVVFNVESWNRVLPEFPISRLTH